MSLNATSVCCYCLDSARSVCCRASAYGLHRRSESTRRICKHVDLLPTLDVSLGSVRRDQTLCDDHSTWRQPEVAVLSRRRLHVYMVCTCFWFFWPIRSDAPLIHHSRETQFAPDGRLKVPSCAEHCSAVYIGVRSMGLSYYEFVVVTRGGTFHFPACGHPQICVQHFLRR